MNKKFNIFISHHGKDDEHVQRLKQRLKSKEYGVRNGSIDKTKHRATIPPDAVVARYLRKGINWAGTFICLIGKETHTRPWVNYEIRQAHLKGKRIVGVFLHGCSNSVDLPETLKRYGNQLLGWNSLGKLMDIISGKNIPFENPDGTVRGPIQNIKRIQC